MLLLWLLFAIGHQVALSAETVLVTGANGFIASHIIKQLLEQGYNVRGTVRSLKEHKTKYNHLYDLQDKNMPNKLELVQADLTSDNNWDNIVQGCQFIMSVANPVPSRQSDSHLSDNDMIETSLGGIKRILNAALKHKNEIKRFILTGSVASNLFNNKKGSLVRRASNESWTDTSNPNLDSYAKAKTLQEKYFWDFIKKHNNPFDAVSINPCMVIGPILNKKAPGSAGVLLALMNEEFPFLPAWNIIFVDVRDVALAHINAMKSEAAIGNRYVIGNYGVWVRDMALILLDKYSEKGYNIPLFVMHEFVWKIIGLFDKVIGEHVAPHLGSLELIIDNQHTTKDLNFQYTAMDKSIYDTAESLIALGYVKEPSNTMSIIKTLALTIIGGIIVACICTCGKK